MEKTTPKEIEDFITWMEIKNVLPKTNADMYNKKLDIPWILDKTVKYSDGRKQISEHYLRVKFNIKGRAQRHYREWPKIIFMSPWLTNYMSRYGLAENIAVESKNYKFPLKGKKTSVVLFISHDGGGQAIYVKDDSLETPFLPIRSTTESYTWAHNNIYILLESEGEIGKRPLPQSETE